MANRNFSMVEYFNKMARRHKPLLAFSGRTTAEWKPWRRDAYAKLRELLGEFPKPAPLRAEVVAQVEEHGVIKERVVFDTERDMSVPCIVCRPKGMKKGGKGRAIVCSHGHGMHGKNPVAGINAGPEVAQDIATLSYNYGELMAQRGFVTLSPDLRVFGERRDGDYGQRDPCNVHFIRGAIFGVYTLMLNIFDLGRCVDYLRTRKEVDGTRIGLMGLSQGGTMATFAGAVDSRFKAVDIICYLNSWRDFGVRDGNFCGSQIVPNIFRYFDTHDVAGLIAPRPLLVEFGMWDTCFPIDDTVQSMKPLRRIYRAAGVASRLEFEIHAKGHAFGAGRAYDFFDKRL
jgi:dienelactone hydrolase